MKRLPVEPHIKQNYQNVNNRNRRPDQMERVKAQQIVLEAKEKRDARMEQYEQEYTTIIELIRKRLDDNPEITGITLNCMSNQVMTWLIEDEFIIRCRPDGLMIVWPDIPRTERAKTEWGQKMEELQARQRAIEQREQENRGIKQQPPFKIP